MDADLRKKISAAMSFCGSEKFRNGRLLTLVVGRQNVGAVKARATGWREPCLGRRDEGGLAW